ncbi:hypothetical protein AQZ49_03300 [Novosphingobium sp. FSW06-99]|nr:hypothetical protein AQZ49_03300 [Novosphingobium sp. FSW06-99]
MRTFITFRVLRILPALFTEVSLSALIFGPMLTVLPLRGYFTSPEFFEYFGSFIGRARFSLPGVFLDNPMPKLVNGALWTVGPEIFCYVTLSLLIVTGIYRQRRAMLAVTILFMLSCIWSDQIDTQAILRALPSRSLICAFLFGNLIYLYRDKLPYSQLLAVGVFVVSLGAIAVAEYSSAYNFLIYPAILGLSYVTAIIGFSPLPPLPFFHRGDYSYGIYIYGFPIQQALLHFFPAHRTALFVTVTALPLTLLCAIGSWHLIEKPVLGLRKHLLPKQRRPVEQEGTVRAWTPRTVGITVCLLAYGLFVAHASALFPLRSAAGRLLGANTPTTTQAGPQF